MPAALQQPRKEAPAIKHIPNLLSLSRIPLSLALPLCRGGWFLVCYLLCGLTDLLDGFAARRLGAASGLGARLDSIGDGVFWAVVLYLVLSRTGLVSGPYATVLLLVCLLRTANLLLTRIKFHRWAMVHSLGNKLTGLLLFLLLPACVLLERVPPPAAGVLVAAALLSSLDETAILLTERDYDPDRKSCLHK